MYRPENLSEDLKTWSYDNSLPNNTTYKFTVMQREGTDPILGGGDILIEGHKSYSGYEWQKATCYSSGNPKKIFFRDKYNNAWSDWDRITTNSDFEVKGYNVTTVANMSKEITGAPTTANYFPVIVGATQTKGHQTTISFDSGKWYAYSNTDQVLSVRFYKIPTST